ncbi:MAG: sulfatase-like hydrolase/transferase [Limisphaerales bacterium]
MKHCFLIFAGLLWAAAVSAVERPNIVIFYVDDLGWADTSVRMMESDPNSASDFHLTPHLAALAKRGIKFSNAYAPAPTCTPSRKSIQFGKTPGRLGYTFVHDVLALQRKLEWKDETSLADVVKAPIRIISPRISARGWAMSGWKQSATMSRTSLSPMVTTGIFMAITSASRTARSCRRITRSGWRRFGKARWILSTRTVASGRF